MKNLNIAPFYVGQKVVYLKTHMNNIHINYPPKNSIVTISAANNTHFGEWHFQIKGYEGRRSTLEEFWFHYEDFAPIQEAKFKAVSFEKMMKETEEICVN